MPWLSDLEKKILISSLGIVVLTLLFAFIHKKSKLIEPIPPFTIPGDDLVVDAQGIINIGEAVAGIGTTTAGAVENTIVTATEGTVNVITTQAMNVLRQLDSTAKFLANKASTAKTSAQSAIRQQVNVVKQQVRDRVRTIKQNIQIEAQRLKAEFVQKVKSKMTFTRFFKYATLLTLLFSKIGRWATKTTQIILMRISNFKTCFIWYALEIIGWILYLPIEFIVWFFCLETWETSFWDMVKEVDCFFNSIMGFHIFYYSDYIRQKCFIPTLPQFPSMGMGGKFSKGGFKKVMKDIFLPVDPNEMAAYVRKGLNEYKETLLNTFEHAGQIDFDQIWQEALSAVDFSDVSELVTGGEQVPDTSDQELSET